MNKPTGSDWRQHNALLYRHNNIKFVKLTPRQHRLDEPFEPQPRNHDVTWLLVIWFIVTVLLLGALIK